MAERDLPRFGERLAELRTKARLTQEELADRARISVRAISDLERSVHPTARKATAELLADALELGGSVREEFLDAAGGRVAQAVPPLEARFSLPPDAAAFTGRRAELDRVCAAVTAAVGLSGSVVTIHAIGGMPGVGKTALAVHAAHLLRDRFPDRQLFIDLHGYTPGQDRLPAEVALAGLLAGIGVQARQLPEGLAARAGLWRDRMAGQRALLVLDNAADSSQVTPLLPGGRDCLVLVTSRRHLGDLPGAVASVPLEVLPPREAQQMFLHLAPRAAAGGEVAELVRLAGFLPLAISLLARVYDRHPAWTLADLTAETRARLLTLAAESDTVAAAFEVSYRSLTPDLQDFFRRLSLHPGAAVEEFAAAALAGTGVPEAAGHLDVLHREALLTEVGYRRYSMHDLIRRYARDRAAADPADGREQALDRLLDVYTGAAWAADAWLARQTGTGAAPAPATAPVAIPELADATEALAWARRERANLLACLDHVTSTGQHARVVALTAALATLFRQEGPWAESISRCAAAVRAARQLGERPGEAGALFNLGIMHRLAGDYPAAEQAQEQALALYRGLGDRLGLANTLCALGNVRRVCGRYPGAAQVQQEALGLFRELGDRHGQANALCELGAVWRVTGDYPGAARAQQEALELYRELGDRPGQANALNYLGAVRQMTGDYQAAARAHEEALMISRDLGHRHGEASALDFLGSARRLAGDYPGADRALEQALVIARDLGLRHREANALTELGSLRRSTGDHRAAAQALSQAFGLYRELGDQASQAMVLNETATLHRAGGDLARAGQCHERALSLARTSESFWDEARALAGLGHCALGAGHPARARELFQQALEIFRRIGAPEAAELEVLTSQQLAGRSGVRS